MNLLTLYPIQSCNLKCEYCPMKQWTYPINDERNSINNDLIFLWLDKFCPPEEWCIEISGGEPGVYPEIEELVNGLTQRGYYGLIKTNGTLPIPHSENFQRIAAWHQSRGLDKPPEYFDQMLIIRNPNDCWEDKRRYCIDRGIIYTDVVFRDFSVPYEQRQDYSESDTRMCTFIKKWTVLYSSGQLSICYSGLNLPEATIQNMYPPPQMDVPKYCLYCCNVNGFEIFLSEEFKQKITKQV